MRSRAAQHHGKQQPLPPPPSSTSTADTASTPLATSLVLYAALFLFRCLTAVCLRTYFNPDEPWQSLEPALSYAVPPLGHRTWEWQPTARIRSHTHILPFILLYKALHIALPLPHTAATHHTARLLHLHAPRLLQSGLIAAADLRLWQLARRLWGGRVGQCAMVCYMANWFLCYVLVRTYSNSMEAALAMVAMSYWPWPGMADEDRKAGVADDRKALLFAALACCVRPTSLHIWLLLAVVRCYSLLSQPSRLASFILSGCAIFSSVLGLSLLLDRLMYGQWTISALNFFHLNSLTSLSTLYGTHPHHWYLTEALPATLTIALPLAVRAGWVWRRDAVVRLMGAVVCWSVLVHSVNAHKEYRFLLPVLPLVCLLAGRGLAAMSERRRWIVVCVYVGVNVLLFGYFGVVHQAGPISAMSFLQDRLSSLSSASSTVSPYAVHFWMPCHSTPFYSALHIVPPPSLRFFDCSPSLPPIPSADPVIAFSTHCTDTHLFDHSPVPFLLHYYNTTASPATANHTTTRTPPPKPLNLTTHCTSLRHHHLTNPHIPLAERHGGGPADGWPTHVVLFDSGLGGGVQRVLDAMGYREVVRLFHAHFGAEREVVILEGLQYARVFG